MADREAGKFIRARSENEKDLRRDQVLDAAARVFSRDDFEAVTMARVAEEAGVAKGTPYRYFATKEALFLELLTREIGDWFAELVPVADEAAVAEAAIAGSGASLPGFVARSLSARPLLTRLLPLLHAVLERNIDVETALRFKRRLAETMAPVAAAFERHLPGGRAGDGFSFILRTHALAIGLLQMSRPSAAVKAALSSDPALAPFDLDFVQEFEAALGALIRGWPSEHP